MPPKPVTDVITSGPGPDAAQSKAAAAARGAQVTPAKQDPETPGDDVAADERVAVQNAALADYAKAVSTAVALLGPVIETTQTAEREAEAHPELPMGQQMAGNMREAMATLERVYEILRRVAAPSAPVA